MHTKVNSQIIFLIIPNLSCHEDQDWETLSKSPRLSLSFKVSMGSRQSVQEATLLQAEHNL